MPPCPFKKVFGFAECYFTAPPILGDRRRRARSDANKNDHYFKVLGVACTHPPSKHSANGKIATPPPLEGGLGRGESGAHAFDIKNKLGDIFSKLLGATHACAER